MVRWREWHWLKKDRASPRRLSDIIGIWLRYWSSLAISWWWPPANHAAAFFQSVQATGTTAVEGKRTPLVNEAGVLTSRA
jgi:hypothetical protein